MGEAARKLTAKDANAKLAHRRLTVLELAERLGNVAEACRRGGIDRTSFYDWKRRFQLQGLDGLKELPPIAKSHPMTTPVEVVERIVELALLHPAYGCNRLEALLALEGLRLSAITIQNILNDKGLGTRHERWLALEQKNAEQATELSPEQAAFLEKLNPCFNERHVESGRPGELLSADTFVVGPLKGIGRVYLHAVVDTFGSYAFRLPSRLQAAGGSGRSAAQLRAAVLCQPRPAGRRRADRQRPRVLRHRAAPLRVLPGAQRHRAQEDPGRLAPHQRFRRALQRHGAEGVLPADNAQRSPPKRRGAPGRPRRLAAPLQPRAPAPWLPQPGPPPVGDCRAICQPVTSKTENLRRRLIYNL
jgi:hypothetical protein